MNKNIIKSALAITIAGSLFTSCKKSFLDKQAISQSSIGNSYKTANDAEVGLTGAYSQAFIQDQYWVWDYTTDGDTRTDNCYAGSNNSDNINIQYYNLVPTNGNVTRDWQGLYQDIYAANTVIDYTPRIPAADFVGTRQAQIIAEAQFIRALCYFHLVTLYGEVPLVTTTINPPANPARSTTATVYAQIISDLKNGEDKLLAANSATPPAVGHATQGACQALLAKVYAQMGDYANCLTYCNKVISSGAYQLVPNYATLFNGTKNTSESIFEMQHSAANGFTTYNIGLYLPANLGTYSFLKFNIPTTNLVNLFKSQGDNVRLNASVLIANVDASGMADGDPVPPPYTTSSPYVPFLYKWKDVVAQFASGDDVIVLRLADIILLAAEANNQLGNTAAAVTQLNQIRTRVNLPNTTATTKNTLATAILTERRLELAFEGERFNDLIRANANGTVDIISLMNSQVDPFGNVLKYGPNGAGVTKNLLLFPVPANEIALDKSLTQNPGY